MLLIRALFPFIMDINLLSALKESEKTFAEEEARRKKIEEEARRKKIEEDVELQKGIESSLAHAKLLKDLQRDHELALKLQFSEAESKLDLPFSVAIAGMKNFGATCFANSVLQYLLNAFERSNINVICEEKECLMCEFVKLYQEYKNNHIREITLKNVIRPIFTRMGRPLELLLGMDYSRLTHEDPDEFFTLFIEILGKTFHGEQFCSKFTGITWYNQQIQNFRFDVGSCRTVAEIIQKNEQIQGLCVVPPFIPVFIQRFYGNGSKNKRAIEISEYIEISSVIYRLQSTIQHTGESSRSGHYISFVRKGDVWFKADDSIIQRSTISEISKEDTSCAIYEKLMR
jgi:uncharacterized UBP type Zn finger protein